MANVQITNHRDCKGITKFVTDRQYYMVETFNSNKTSFSNLNSSNNWHR